MNLVRKRTEWGKKKAPSNDTAAATTEVAVATDDKDAELYNIESEFHHHLYVCVRFIGDC